MIHLLCAHGGCWRGAVSPQAVLGPIVAVMAARELLVGSAMLEISGSGSDPARVILYPAQMCMQWPYVPRGSSEMSGATCLAYGDVTAELLKPLLPGLHEPLALMATETSHLPGQVVYGALFAVLVAGFLPLLACILAMLASRARPLDEDSPARGCGCNGVMRVALATLVFGMGPSLAVFGSLTESMRSRRLADETLWQNHLGELAIYEAQTAGQLQLSSTTSDFFNPLWCIVAEVGLLAAQATQLSCGCRSQAALPAEEMTAPARDSPAGAAPAEAGTASRSACARCHCAAHPTDNWLPRARASSEMEPCLRPETRKWVALPLAVVQACSLVVCVWASWTPALQVRGDLRLSKGGVSPSWVVQVWYTVQDGQVCVATSSGWTKQMGFATRACYSATAPRRLVLLGPNSQPTSTSPDLSSVVLPAAAAATTILGQFRPWQLVATVFSLAMTIGIAVLAVPGRARLWHLRWLGPPAAVSLVVTALAAAVTSIRAVATISSLALLPQLGIANSQSFSSLSAEAKALARLMRPFGSPLNAAGARTTGVELPSLPAGIVVAVLSTAGAAFSVAVAVALARQLQRLLPEGSAWCDFQSCGSPMPCCRPQHDRLRASAADAAARAAQPAQVSRSAVANAVHTGGGPAAEHGIAASGGAGDLGDERSLLAELAEDTGDDELEVELVAISTESDCRPQAV